MNRTIGSKRIAAVTASFVFAFTGVTGAGIAGAAPALADAPAQSQQAARYEVDFLKNMIDHHTMAIMMAETCVEKAVHEELRALCESIIEAQSAEIEQMQTWLQDWYGISYEPQLSSGQMQSMQRLEKLSGAKFETEFMRSMIRHHWKAIREAETCLDRAEHSELLHMCQDIKEAQLQEISQLQSWLEEWYDRAGGRPARTA